MEESIYTLQQLLSQVKGALDVAFPLSVWVKAEIQSLSVNRSGHCYIDLIEKNMLTGALLALGMAGIEAPEAANEVIRRIKENHNGMIECKDLLRVNAEKGGEKTPHCNAMIREAIGITEEILKREGKLK